MTRQFILTFLIILFLYNFSSAQVVMSITNYSVNNSGQALLSIEAQEDKYYVLTSQHSPTFEWATSVNIGVNGTMIISDPGGSYPIENYTITEYDIANPGDIDGDGILGVEDCDDLDSVSTIIVDDMDCDGVMNEEDDDIGGEISDSDESDNPDLAEVDII